MKLNKINEVTKFLNVVDTCKGDVFLTSPYGDKYNLKSKLTQYIAIAALLNADNSELELWCDDNSDEGKFMEFFNENPSTL